VGAAAYPAEHLADPAAVPACDHRSRHTHHRQAAAAAAARQGAVHPSRDVQRQGTRIPAEAVAVRGTDKWRVDAKEEKT